MHPFGCNRFKIKLFYLIINMLHIILKGLLQVLFYGVCLLPETILTNEKMKPELNSYDYIIVAMSGGKDSTACFLHLLEQGVDMNKVELWHHLIDGREGSELMDWAVTEDYCRKFADAFKVPVFYSWREGGFEREMLRNQSLTGDVLFETPDNALVRRESSNQERFNGKKTLFITGERGEESAARSKYEQFEPHQCDRREGKLQRHVDHWRPVLQWKETEVWAIIERNSVVPHPAYYLGWGRVSCAGCIFGSKNAFASLNKINPKQVKRISEYEEQFKITIKRNNPVSKMIAEGTPYEGCDDAEMVALSQNINYNGQIFTNNWVLPKGAFGENCGAI